MTSHIRKSALMAGVAAIGLLFFHPSSARANNSNAAGIIWQAGSDILQQQVGNSNYNNYDRHYRDRRGDDRGYERDRGGDDHGADRGDDGGGDRGGDDNGGGRGDDGGGGGGDD